jgi:hypothetical protein
MDIEQFKQLVDRARNDPSFFHSLVFDPEKAITEIPGLDRLSKAGLLGINPEVLLSRVLRAEGGCTDPTCGPDSCLETCGPHSCVSTCKSSCAGSTCGAWSCGETTSIVFRAIEP